MNSLFKSPIKACLPRSGRPYYYNPYSGCLYGNHIVKLVNEVNEIALLDRKSPVSGSSLAYLAMHGALPECPAEYLDGDTRNLKWSNLKFAE
jgi:hypothetical protein